MMDFAYQFLLPLVAFGVCWWPCCETTPADPCPAPCKACVTSGSPSFPSAIDVVIPSIGDTVNCDCSAFAGTYRAVYVSCTRSTVGGVTCVNDARYSIEISAGILSDLVVSSPRCDATKFRIEVAIRWNGSISTHLGTLRTIQVILCASTGSACTGNYQYSWLLSESAPAALAAYDCQAFSSTAIAFSARTVTPGTKVYCDTPPSGSADITAVP